MCICTAFLIVNKNTSLSGQNLYLNNYSWILFVFIYSPHPAVWSDSSQWDIPLQIPVDNFFPGYDKFWCSQQHSILIHGENGGNDSLPYFYSIGYLGRGPNLANETTGPTYGWSCKCMKTWSSTIPVPPAKVLLLVTYRICCLNIPFVLSVNLLLSGYRGDRTSIQCFLLLPCRDLWDVPPNHCLSDEGFCTRYPTSVIV